jgi:hypothetical protein
VTSLELIEHSEATFVEEVKGGFVIYSDEEFRFRPTGFEWTYGNMKSTVDPDGNVDMWVEDGIGLVSTSKYCMKVWS